MNNVLTLLQTYVTDKGAYRAECAQKHLTALGCTSEDLLFAFRGGRGANNATDMYRQAIDLNRDYVVETDHIQETEEVAQKLVDSEKTWINILKQLNEKASDQDSKRAILDYYSLSFLDDVTRIEDLPLEKEDGKKEYLHLSSKTRWDWPTNLPMYRESALGLGEELYRDHIINEEEFEKCLATIKSGDSYNENLDLLKERFDLGLDIIYSSLNSQEESKISDELGIVPENTGKDGIETLTDKMMDADLSYLILQYRQARAITYLGLAMYTKECITEGTQGIDGDDPKKTFLDNMLDYSQKTMTDIRKTVVDFAKENLTNTSNAKEREQIKTLLNILHQQDDVTNHFQNDLDILIADGMEKNLITEDTKEFLDNQIAIYTSQTEETYGRKRNGLYTEGETAYHDEISYLLSKIYDLNHQMSIFDDVDMPRLNESVSTYELEVDDNGIIEF